jgi:hypothetical protein
LARRPALPADRALTGVITAVWLDTQIDNQSSAWNVPGPGGVELASVDLIVGVPVGSRPSQRRPL